MIATQFGHWPITQPYRIRERCRPAVLVIGTYVLIPMRNVGVQHSRRPAGGVLWIERFVDIDELSACRKHFADPARTGPGQSGDENRRSFLSECAVGHLRTLFLYRPAWMDRHALLTVSLNRQFAHRLAELPFTHQ